MANNSVKWALILGGSSGIGLATARKLAMHGYSLVVLHRDRRADMMEVENEFEFIRSSGVQLKSFNVDALNKVKIEEVFPTISELLGESKISVLVHSIAKGNLKPLSSIDSQDSLDAQDFEHTINAMGISFYTWTKLLLEKDLFAPDSRVIAFTSEGSCKAWEGYAAVSAAKAGLEAISRAMALEFAPMGLRVNCIQAGVTDTQSFRRIPNSDFLKKQALAKNPFKRLTTPEDVANAVFLLTTEEAKWINGTVLKVDGGESLR